MRTIRLQMIDHTVSSLWWKALVEHFVQAGDLLEIRCWKEERAEIQQASLYGNPVDDQYEVSVKGLVTAEFLAEILSEEPRDKSTYNKMTKYFAIHAEHDQRSFCSEHYGTELYLIGISDRDAALFQNIMEPYSEEFSVHIER